MDDKSRSLLGRVAQILTGDADPASGATTLELRKALLREVEFALLPFHSLHPVPVDRVDVLVRAPEPDVRQRLEYAVHHETPPFAQAAHLQLAHAGLELPPEARIEPRFLDAWPDGLDVAPNRRVFVHLHRNDAQGAAYVEQGTAVLRVLRGETERREYALDRRAPVAIGRGREHLVQSGDGPLRRRVNTVAFVEPTGETPDAVAQVNAGVSRAHATVAFDKDAGRYRVCWDGNAPVVHVRGDQRLEIRSALQHVYLEDGDLLELGAGAVLEFRGA